jgi:hypothetical protein
VDLEASRTLCRQVASWTVFLSPAVGMWFRRLRGARLAAFESYDRQYGSGDGYAIQEDYTFDVGGGYVYQRQSRTSVSSEIGSAYAGSTHREVKQGTWAVVEHSGTATLRLQTARGFPQFFALREDAGYYFLGHRKFFVRK